MDYIRYSYFDVFELVFIFLFKFLFYVISSQKSHKYSKKWSVEYKFPNFEILSVWIIKSSHHAGVNNSSNYSSHYYWFGFFVHIFNTWVRFFNECWHWITLAKHQYGLYPPYTTSGKQLNSKFLGRKSYSRVLVEINGNFYKNLNNIRPIQSL